MPASIQNWLKEQGFGDLKNQELLSGGCINSVSRLHTTHGSLILKQNQRAPTNMFAAEAHGLEALKQTMALRIPDVVHYDTDSILLEDLGESAADSNYWCSLGEQLAHMHSQTSRQFGLDIDNYCGATLQINTRLEDGYQFFAEHRLLELGRRALSNGLLGKAQFSQLENISQQLPQLIPLLPAVLIHGDLWSGNAHCDAQGNPALIDPACYWGWAEAELAMTTLFGGFPREFYDCYENTSNIAKDWRERSDLYNVYHLLNHLLLFGGSYLASIQSILNRYARSQSTPSDATH